MMGLAVADRVGWLEVGTWMSFGIEGKARGVQGALSCCFAQWGLMVLVI